MRIGCHGRAIFLGKTKRMDVGSAILIVENDANSLLCAPPLDHSTRQERHARSYKIIEKKIASAGPGSPTIRPDEMKQEVGRLGKKDDEGLGPSAAHPAPDHCTGIFIEPRVPPVRFVNRQVHLTRRFQNAAVFGECSPGIVGVMDHTIGNHYVGRFVRERKVQIVSDDSRPVVTLNDHTH